MPFENFKYPPPGYGERGERIKGATAAGYTTQRPGAGPTVTPEDPYTGFPPAIGGNPPTTAPYNPRFETPNIQPRQTPEPTFTPTPTPFPGTSPTELPSPYGGPSSFTGGTSWTEPMYYPPFAANYVSPGTFQGATPTELPSPIDIPWYQQQAIYPESIPPPSNAPPATYEGMTPTGPNDYLPSSGANIPTYEGMTPTAPDQFLPSTAGANVPTDETMVPTGPEEYRPATETAPPAEAQPASYYPAGDGSYVALDASGNPVGDIPAPVPRLSDRPPGTSQDVGPPEFGGWGQPAGYFPSGTSGPGPLSNLFASGITANDVLASGVSPRWTSGTVPAPGGWGGTFGQGSWGDIPFYGYQNYLRGMKYGFTPDVVGAGRGMSDPASQFGRSLGKFSTPSYATIGQYYSPNRGFTGDVGSASKSGPNARAMSTA